MSRVPILVILGATGTGKSKLAIELASKYFGEIISADSMQVYKGLDVITAKVTKKEQAMAPHHMLDILDPLSIFTVVDFRNRALPLIDKLIKDETMPVIVGGTNYYIESLLWQVLVEDPKETEDGACSLVFERDCGIIKISDGRSRTIKSNDDRGVQVSPEIVESIRNSDEVDTADYVDSVDDDHSKNDRFIGDKCKKSDTKDLFDPDKEGKIPTEQLHTESTAPGDGDGSSPSEHEQPPFKKVKYDDDRVSNEELHKMLKEVDPEMADRLHPNNRRKILRSLQVFEQFGVKHSEILKEQRLAGGSGLGGPLRYKNSIILWLQCKQEVLDKRLDLRIDSMLENGLVQELIDFHDRYNRERIKSKTLPDYTKGIFQSIGFKEFHEYLILDDEEKRTKKGEELLEQGIKYLRIRTKKYARRQHKWVKNRFIDRSDREVPPVYSLDCTDLDKWNEKVLEPAILIINQKLRGKTPSYEALNNDKTDEKKNFCDKFDQTHFCETCERVLIGELQWKAHLHGRKHEKMVKKSKIESQKPM